MIKKENISYFRNMLKLLYWIQVEKGIPLQTIKDYKIYPL